jgi:hypothetical protein
VCLRSTTRFNRVTEIFVVTITDRATLCRMLGDELYLAFPTRITDAFDPWMSQHFTYYREILHDMHARPGKYADELARIIERDFGVAPTSKQGFVPRTSWADDPSPETCELTKRKVLEELPSRDMDAISEAKSFPNAPISTNFRAAQLIYVAKENKTKFSVAPTRKRERGLAATANVPIAFTATGMPQPNDDLRGSSITPPQEAFEEVVSSESNAVDVRVLQNVLDEILDHPLPLEPFQPAKAVKEGCPACSWSEGAGVFPTPDSFAAIDAVVRFSNEISVAFQLKDRHQLSSKEWSNVFNSLTSLASKNTRMASFNRLDRILFVVAGRTDSAIPWDSITLGSGTTLSRLTLQTTPDRRRPRGSPDPPTHSSNPYSGAPDTPL